MKLRTSLLYAALLLPLSAIAQNEFPTPTAGKTVLGDVGMCLNSLGKAVPYGPTCANAIPVTSTGSPSGTQDVNLKQVGATTFSLGSKTGANSLSIVPASDMVLPLPTGAATAANQSTEITSLATIVTNTGKIPSLGQALAAASVPVVMTAAQITTLTPLSTVAVTQSTSPWVSNDPGLPDTLGVKTAANSTSIAPASDSTFPVTGTFYQETQPISGTVTVTDGAGALNVIVDSGTTAVTQATGTNLHAVLDTTSTTAVTQATGTNLHAVLDTTSTTAVTQATASNLNAAVVGTGTAGTPAGGVLTVQGATSMTALNASVDNVVDGTSISCSAASAVILTCAGSAGPFSTVGYAVVQLQVLTQSATSITPQFSADAGTDLSTVKCVVLSSATLVPVTAITQTGVYECPAGNAFQLTQVGAGSTSVKVTPKRVPTISMPISWTNASTNSTSMLQVGGYDGSTARRITVDGSGNVSSVGSVASAAADSGNPLKTGGKYNATSLQLTDGNRGDTQIDANGATVIAQNAVRANRWNYAAAASGISNSTTAVTVKAAAASGLRNCITDIQLSSDALGAATEFAIRDGAAGTVLWRTKIGTSGYISGYSTVFEGSPLCGTAATLLEVVTLTASITGAVYFNAQGYLAP